MARSEIGVPTRGVAFEVVAEDEAITAFVVSEVADAAAVLEYVAVTEAVVECMLGSAALLGFRVVGTRPVGSTLNNKRLAEIGINKRPLRVRRACCKVRVQDNDELIIEKVWRSRPNSYFLHGEYLMNDIEYSIGARSKSVFDKNLNKQLLLIKFAGHFAFQTKS